MTIGTGATAFAQPVGNPIVPDASGSSAGTEVADDVADAVTAGERVQLGENIKMDGLYEVLYEVALFKQLTSGATVTPGGLVTTRIEIIGNNDNGGKVREIAVIMPQGFELVSVTRVKENALGEALHVVPAKDRTVVPAGNGMQEVRLSWTEGGFLGLFEDNPTVSKSKSIVVDFTYRAPQELGQYQHGGFVRIGSLIVPEFRNETDGTPITVENSLPAAVGSLGSS